MEDEVREKLRSGIYIIKRKKGQAAKSNVLAFFFCTANVKTLNEHFRVINEKKKVSGYLV